PLLHKWHVQTALRVRDPLGRFRDLDRRGSVQAGRYHRAVDRDHDLEGLRILAGHNLPDRLETVGLVAWIDPFGRISDREITSGRETRSLLQNRHAILLGRAGIDG